MDTSSSAARNMRERLAYLPITEREVYDAVLSKHHFLTAYVAGV